MSSAAVGYITSLVPVLLKDVSPVEKFWLLSQKGLTPL